MDSKKIIKTVLIIVFVPSAIVGAYYGYKLGRKKYDEWKLKQNKNEGNNNK